jgi:hypothetical protein
MRYFVDTEFIDDGKTIDLISIGIVAEDGREFYAESDEFDREKAGDWVKEHVYPHLSGYCAILSTRQSIKEAIMRFLDVEAFGTPEFWGWCAAYDWVALCQVFGPMMNLPVGWPHYIRDIQQVLDERGIADEMLPQNTGAAHNALADARYMKVLWIWLMRPYTTRIEVTEDGMARMKARLDHYDQEKVKGNEIDIMVPLDNYGTFRMDPEVWNAIGSPIDIKALEKALLLPEEYRVYSFMWGYSHGTSYCTVTITSPLIPDELNGAELILIYNKKVGESACFDRMEVSQPGLAERVCLPLKLDR